MKKIILGMILTILSLNAWEVNTHRAIDRKSIEESKSSGNLKIFIENSGIPNDNKYYNNEKFEFYGKTYIEYAKNGEEGISKWNQEFTNKPSFQNMIEAGTILEDALWPSAMNAGDGRFNNHFYDPQNNGKGLTFGWGRHTNAVNWAKKGSHLYNMYSFDAALRWFKIAFTTEKQKDRKKYQAKMLVSVGHLMHLMNDMNVPAHTRDDSHPLGDPLEVWMRGGENGDEDSGFYVKGSEIANKRYSIGDLILMYSRFADGIINEAEYTAKHFFSKDTVFYDDYSPRKDDVIIPELNYHPSDYKYITDADGNKLAVVYWSHWFGKKRYTIDNSIASEKVHQYYGSVLIPRAIANATGFLNYFFRGSMSATLNGDNSLSVANISDESLVASAGVVTFKSGGKIGLYYDDASTGNRVSLLEYTLDDDLVSGESISIQLDLDQATYNNIKDKKLIVVYDGHIGSERGLAVATVDISGYSFGGGDDDGDDNGTDTGSGDDNSGDDNNTTDDPTQDPNKVCVSNYFKYYGDGKIHDSLKKGDKDAELYSDGTKHQVKEMQEFLQAFGYDVGSSGADGWFGSDTEDALISFQSNNDLDADGIVGPKTRKAMNSQNCYDK